MGYSLWNCLLSVLTAIFIVVDKLKNLVKFDLYSGNLNDDMFLESEIGRLHSHSKVGHVRLHNNSAARSKAHTTPEVQEHNDIRVKLPGYIHGLTPTDLIKVQKNDP